MLSSVPVNSPVSRCENESASLGAGCGLFTLQLSSLSHFTISRIMLFFFFFGAS